MPREQVTMSLQCRQVSQSAFPGMTDLSGKQVVGLGQFIKEYNDSFEFKFVDPDDLSSSERRIYDRTDEIASPRWRMPKVVKEIRVSETMNKELSTFEEPMGLWEARTSESS